MKKVTYILLGAALSLLILMSAIESVSFNKQHYISQYRRNNIVDRHPISNDSLVFITESIIGYLQGNTDNLNIQALIGQEVRDVFSEREIEHMRDVKDLFILGKRIMLYMIILLLLLIGICIRLDNNWKRNLSVTLKNTAIANGSVLVLLFGLINYNFTKYFDYFHYVFFTNDLWILDPNAELLVQILPEEFFISTTIKIALVFYIPILLLGLLSSYYLFIRKAFE